MYLNLNHEFIGPLLGYLDEAFGTFTSRMNCVAVYPSCQMMGSPPKRGRHTPHDFNIGNTA